MIVNYSSYNYKRLEKHRTPHKFIMFSQYKYADPCSFSFSKQFTTYMRIEPFCLSIENNDKRKQLQMKMKKYKREEEREKFVKLHIVDLILIRHCHVLWKEKTQCLASAYFYTNLDMTFC